MTDPAGGVGAAERTDDPFVRQVAWLIATAGGKDLLVARSGNRVSARTLDNWTAGLYPRHKVTGAVRDLDAWATQHMPGYPAAAGVPRLTDSCGPYRGNRTAEPEPEPAPAPEPEPEPEATDDPPTTAEDTTDSPPPRPRRAWRRPAAVAAGLLAVVAVTVGTTVLIMRHAEAGEEAREAAAADNSVSVARKVAATPLPSSGDGVLRPEQVGSIGANTFSDPRTLTDRALPLPPHTTVMVRCRYYAPSVPSVTPDGFWYLLDSGEWSGRWSPANSYMNGDVPGGPTLHNTDFAIPVCR